MSETTGGPGESNKERNEDSDFDREWAEFNKNLEQSPTAEEQAEDARISAEADACRDFVWDTLYQKDIDRVIDRNVDNELTLFAEFTVRYCQAKMEEYRLTGEEDPDRLEREIALSCIFEYFNERELQAMIMNTAAALNYMATNQRATETSRQQVQDLKKQLQAEVIIHFKRGLHDPWQQLLNELVPGESLDMSNPLDIPYVFIAKATQYQFDAERAKRAELVAKAIEIMGVNVQEDEVPEVVQAYADLINMQIDASGPIYNETERANRNAGLWEYVRQMGLPHDTAKKLVDLFDEAYPILY